MGLEQILKTLIPQQKVVVGGKSSAGIPMDVRISIDPQLEKTIIKSVSILTLGIALGTATGIVISNHKKGR